MNYKVNKIIALVVLCLSAMTFMLPRETFDAHIGTDYDIFCKMYHGMQIDSVAPEVTLKEVGNTDYNFVIISELKILIFSVTCFLRGPPSFISYI